MALTRCVVSGNSSAASGGGVWTSGTLTLNNCIIISNRVSNSSGAYGGGVSVGGTLTLNGCAIVGNSLSGIDTYGAGAYSEAAITAVDSVIADNTAQAYRLDSEAYCRGTGLFCRTNVSLRTCQVLRNYAYAAVGGGGHRIPYNYGGGIYCERLTASCSVISSNSVSSDSASGNSDGRVEVCLQRASLPATRLSPQLGACSWRARGLHSEQPGGWDVSHNNC